MTRQRTGRVDSDDGHDDDDDVSDGDDGKFDCFISSW